MILVEIVGGSLMFRAVVFELAEDNAKEAMLRVQREGYVQIVEWLGNDHGSGVITHDYGTLQNVEVLREYYQTCPKEIYDKIYQRLYNFLNLADRIGERPIYYRVNAFNLYLGYYYGMFTQKKINLLIFGDIPHFGIDSMAKEVADALGIRCVMFQQSIHKNTFFAFSDINDIGIFASLPNKRDAKMQLDGNFEKDLYYMKDIHVVEPNSDHIAVDKNLYTIVHKIKIHRQHLLKKVQEKAYSAMQMRSSQWLKRNMYFQNMKNALQNADVDLNKNYVYFPLHFQPEVTTSVRGGEYDDQILAIERLAQMIPVEWRIYVKENPKQSYYMRDELFFERLQLLPQVQFVGREFNTYDLIRHSRFVATITGTAGWEAISGGKPVLVFGLAWYRKFPGVFEYKDNPSLDDILQCNIDIHEVENANNRLLSKGYPGILQIGAEKQLENYSYERNNELLYNAFVHILGILQHDAQQAEK